MTAKEAIACFLSIDKDQLTKANYKEGSYTKTIYKIDDKIFAAIKPDNPLPKPRRRDAEPIQWTEIIDPYINDKGWEIYRAIK